MNLSCRTILVLTVLQLVGCAASAANAADPATQPATPATKPAESAAKGTLIRSQLARKLPEVKFEGVGFADVLDFMHDVTGIKLDVNWEALQAAGLAKDSPVTARLFNVKTSKALSVILDSVSTQQMRLHSEIDVNNEQLVITTYDDYVAHNTEDREYDIRNLVPSDVRGRKAEAAVYDDLSKLIVETVAPNSWAAAGGKPGAIKIKDGRLIITQTRENHTQIESLMAQLRETHAHTTTQQSDQAPRRAGP